jgi:FkbM family methyltransferase
MIGLFEENSNKRYFFIDVGGHVGKAVQRFRDKRDPQYKFYIYSFEPNPDKIQLFEGLKNHVLIPRAAWIKNEKKEFIIGDENFGDGSTLIFSKSTGKLRRSTPILVDCIDFSWWLKSSFSSDDYIIVKFNIEGSEYPILDKMMADSTITLLNELIVYWHWYMIKMPFEAHRDFVSKLDRYPEINKKYFSNGEKYLKNREKRNGNNLSK